MVLYEAGWVPTNGFHAVFYAHVDLEKYSLQKLDEEIIFGKD